MMLLTLDVVSGRQLWFELMNQLTVGVARHAVEATIDSGSSGRTPISGINR